MKAKNRTAGYRLRRVSYRGGCISAAWEVEELGTTMMVFCSKSAKGWQLSARSTTPQPPLPWLRWTRQCYGNDFYGWSWGAFFTRQALLEALRLAHERSAPSVPAALPEVLA